jgi:hypothetical protein
MHLMASLPLWGIEANAIEATGTEPNRANKKWL